MHGCGQVAAVGAVGEPGARGPGQGGQCGPCGAQIRGRVGRVDEHPGVEHPVGVEGGLETGERFQGPGGVHEREQGAAGTAVAVLPGQRAAVRGDQAGGVGEELPEPARPLRTVEREVEPYVHAPLAEVPVGQPGEPVAGQQLLEPAQVGPERRGWHGGVLPPGVRGRPVGRPGGEPRPVGPDPPQWCRVPGVGDHQRIRGLRGGHHLPGAGGHLPLLLAGHLHQQPPGATGHRGQPGRAVPVSHGVDDAAVQSLAGGGVQGKQGGYGVGGVGHGRVAECHEEALRRFGDQAQRGAENDRESALAADESPHLGPRVLRQQVLQGVAGNLPGEGAELRAHAGEVGGDGPAGGGERGWLRRGRGGVGGEPQPLPGAGHGVEGEHIVAGAPVAEGTRAAGVVADHAADGAPVGAGRVGSEPQPVPGGGPLQVGVHDPGLHGGGAGLRVEVDDPVEVTGQVEHHARSDGVPGDGGAPAADGQRHAEVAAHLQGGDHLLGVPGEGHRGGHDPVQGGVGGVQRPVQGPGVGTGHTGTVQVGGDLRGGRPVPAGGGGDVDGDRAPRDRPAVVGGPAAARDRRVPASAGSPPMVAHRRVPGRVRRFRGADVHRGAHRGRGLAVRPSGGTRTGFHDTK